MQSCQNHLFQSVWFFSDFLNPYSILQSFIWRVPPSNRVFILRALHHRIRALRHSFFSAAPPKLFSLLTSLPLPLLFCLFSSSSLQPRFIFFFWVSVHQFDPCDFLSFNFSSFFLLSDDSSSPAAIIGRRRTTTFYSKIHIDRITDYRLQT